MEEVSWSPSMDSGIEEASSSSSGSSSIGIVAASAPSHECAVCGNTANGIHFGVVSCRACAAFYRRCVVLNLSFKCVRGQRAVGLCFISKEEPFACRCCRLKKCVQLGMKQDNVQLHRDRTAAVRASSVAARLANDINTPCEHPEDQEKGRKSTHSSASLEKAQNSNASFPIDSSALNKNLTVSRSLEMPSVSSSSLTTRRPLLSRLLIGLRHLRPQPPDTLELVTNVNRTTWNMFYEYGTTKFASFLMHYEDFAVLSMDQKLPFYKIRCRLCIRFERLHALISFMGRDRFLAELDKGNLPIAETDRYYFDFANGHYDIDFVVNRDLEETRQMFVPVYRQLLKVVGGALLHDTLDDVEVVYVLTLIIWNVEGQSEVSRELEEIAGSIRERLTEEMHEYYVTERAQPYYASRLTRIVAIAADFDFVEHERRRIIEFAKIFDTFRDIFSGEKYALPGE